MASVTLCYFFFSLLFLNSSMGITDTFRQGQQFGYPDRLVSRNNYFILKFFNPDNKENRHYLGVFYNHPRQNKAIWVANRNNPITNITAILTLDAYANLKISNNSSDSFVLNSLSIKWYQEQKINASATLQDDGNFVLREINLNGSTKRVLWQSFDYPTDTLLPGMKLGINFKTRQNWSLISWISEHDPSHGAFTLGVDPTNTKQLVIWWKGTIYWKSGTWNDGKFKFVPLLSHEYYHKFSELSDEDESYYTFSMIKNYTFPKYRMGSTGIVSESRGSAIFGDCYPSSTYSYGGGCDKLPECRDSKSRFMKENGYIYGDPLMIDENKNLSLFDCEAKCWSNCSCAAYGSINDDETGCQLWSKDMLVDGNYPDSSRRGEHRYRRSNFQVWSEDTGVVDDNNSGEEIYPNRRDIYVLYESYYGDSRVEKNLSTVLLIIAAAGVPVVVMLCSLFQLIRKKHRFIGTIKAGFWALILIVTKLGMKLVLLIKTYVAELKRKRERSKRMLMSLEKLNKDGKKSSELRFFSFQTIAFATNNFAPANKVGEGGFGPVYKGQLLDGLEIAIKRLSRNSGQGLAEFKNELTLIARVQHTNLVKLVGCCIQRKEMMLIYEYMPNKSLDFFLFNPSRRCLLDWKKRYNIIQGISQGLLYLHKYSRLRMIHRDLKAGNILLDEEMNPKISDFGMARIFEQHESKANTDRIVGTYGYMSPEYAMDGICSMKSDVFSFGVLLLEIISGTKNNSYNQPDRQLTLAGHSWNLWKEGRCMELMDPTLEDSYEQNEVLRCIHVGLLSVQENPADRPTMADVTAMIGYDTIPLPEPKQPAFLFNKRAQGEEIDVEEGLKTLSLNTASMTIMEAR